VELAPSVIERLRSERTLINSNLSRHIPIKIITVCDPGSDSVWCLLRYVEDQGYRHELHGLVTSYPKRNLSKIDKTTSLQALGMKRETIHVQPMVAPE
jgi:7-cyano-7-deazaguanine synthase in queuosine biosynthesis